MPYGTERAADKPAHSMSRLVTTHFGQLEFENSAAYHFPSGLPGFENERSFVFLNRPGTAPLIFMQSVFNPNLCFILLPILAADSNYCLSLSPEDLSALRFSEDADPQIGRDILCAALICAGDGERPPTVNLLAPIVVNLAKGIGVQVIQSQFGYSHQQPLFPQQELSPC